MTANMKRRRTVTRRMLPMFFTATMTHCTTCFRPLARLMALQRSNVLQVQKMEIANTIAKQLMDNKHLRGRRTLRTLRILTTEIAPELM